MESVHACSIKCQFLGWFSQETSYRPKNRQILMQAALIMQCSIHCRYDSSILHTGKYLVIKLWHCGKIRVSSVFLSIQILILYPYIPKAPKTYFYWWPLPLPYRDHICHSTKIRFSYFLEYNTHSKGKENIPWDPEILIESSWSQLEFWQDDLYSLTFTRKKWLAFTHI